MKILYFRVLSVIDYHTFLLRGHIFMLKMYLSYINLIYFISISLNFIVFDQILQNLGAFYVKKCRFYINLFVGVGISMVKYYQLHR